MAIPFSFANSTACALSTLAPASASSCVSSYVSASILCFDVSRGFEVSVDFVDPRTGLHGTGQAVPLTENSGAFTFFDAANLELVVKVLDGGPVNGKVWFFYGALSDVDYTITVTDTATGARRSYHNPRGRICGGADVAAF